LRGARAGLAAALAGAAAAFAGAAALVADGVYDPFADPDSD